jgi:hypothetical protein
MAGTSPNPSLDGESRVNEVVIILSVACTLSTLVVALRCYTRAVILRSFGPDDALIIPAQVRRPTGDKRRAKNVLTGIQQILTIASAVAIGLGKS